MRTEDLIRTLAADATPPRPLAATLASGLPPALAAAAAAVGLTLGYRPDLGSAMFDPVSAARYVLPLLLMALALPLVLRLARPEGAEGARLWPLLLPALGAGGLVIWALATTPAQGWGMAWVGKTMIWCLVSIPALSVLPAIAIFAMLRRGAPTAPRLAGMTAGLAASGGAAAAYALHCTEDSPLFYVSWYGLAILAVTAGCAWVGPRVLRW
jgi:hypothetical protein